MYIERWGLANYRIDPSWLRVSLSPWEWEFHLSVESDPGRPSEGPHLREGWTGGELHCSGWSTSYCPWSYGVLYHRFPPPPIIGGSPNHLNNWSQLAYYSQSNWYLNLYPSLDLWPNWSNSWPLRMICYTPTYMHSSSCAVPSTYYYDPLHRRVGRLSSIPLWSTTHSVCAGWRRSVGSVTSISCSH